MRQGIGWFFALVALAGGGDLASDLDASGVRAPRLRWVSPGGTSPWTVALDAGKAPALDPVPRSLLAANEPGLELPDLALAMYPEGSVSLRERGGRALILSFWASWCQPCATELPKLQRLHEAYRHRGLDVVAVNMEEPEATALSFARSLGLSLGVGRYDPALDAALRVRSMPTVIVADASGRIRARWNGYRTDLVETIEALVTELLAGDPAEDPELGRVILGGDSLAVAWSLRWSAPIEGLASAIGSDGAELRFVAGRDLVRVDLEGRIAGRHSAPRGAGLLRTADLDGDGLDEWITFRRGGSRVVALTPAGEVLQSWEPESPVLDLVPVPASDPGAAGSILLGTLQGLERAGLDGSHSPVAEGVRGVRALAAAGAGPAAALELGGRLCWLGTSFAASCAEPDFPALGMASAGAGVSGIGLFSDSVLDLVSGRFLAPDSVELAIALPGELLLLDARTGRPVYRALWPGIERLAIHPAASGRERLAVGSARRVTLLGPPPQAEEAAADGR